MARKRIVSVLLLVAVAIAGGLFLIFRGSRRKESEAVQPVPVPPAAQRSQGNDSNPDHDDKPVALPCRGNEPERGAVDDLSEILRAPDLKLPQWEQALSLGEASVKELPAPDDPVVVEYRPALGTVYYYVTTSTTKVGVAEMRTLAKYTLSFAKGDKGDLLIAEERQPAWVMAGNNVAPPIAREQQRNMILRDGAVYAGRETNGQVVIAGSSPLAPLERENIWYGIPEDLALRVGASWTSGDESPSRAKHVVSGYAEVNGIRAVKVVSERDSVGEVRHLVGGAGDSTGLKDSNIRTTTYIAVDTGLVVRQELCLTLAVGANRSSTTAVTQFLGYGEEQK